MAGQGYPDDAVPNLNYILGEPKEYNTSVAVSGTPNTHSINTDLGRCATVGYILNDDPTNDLRVYISKDGTTYNNYASLTAAQTASGWITLKPTEGLDLSKFWSHTIVVDASGNTTAYRIVVI